jgi:hypothetical protein
MKNLLVIGKNWPEPHTTAAGYRMIQLLEVFKEDGYKIHFACAAAKSEYSEDLNALEIIEKSIVLNDTSFNAYVKELLPELVLFDRFMTEEQYGWRVRENSPGSLHILDTEDLHFLRKAREEAFKKKQPIDLFGEAAMREIAAIYRCDLSIIISSVEHHLLRNSFHIPESKLVYVPFLHKSADLQKASKVPLAYKLRCNFIMIGNSLHAPNYDAILYVKNTIWPLIRKKLPYVEIHIYGAYQSEKIHQLDNSSEGFLIKGHAPNAVDTLEQYRMLLAPLRFGAGLKGKILDAMYALTPVAMSTIAAEGMFKGATAYGFVEDDIDKYVQQSVNLYSKERDWVAISETNINLLQENFSRPAFAKALLFKISRIVLNQGVLVDQNTFFERMLNYHSYSRYKYLSKWIHQKSLNSK